MTILLCELRKQEETTILELLDLTTDELVDAFLEKVEEREEYIRKALGF